MQRYLKKQKKKMYFNNFKKVILQEPLYPSLTWLSLPIMTHVWHTEDAPQTESVLLIILHDVKHSTEGMIGTLIYKAHKEST